MKAPNVISLVAMLGVVLPAVILAISQQFPPEMYWWSALITTVIGGVLKALEVWINAPQPQVLPQMPAGMMATPQPAEQQPSKIKAILWQ